MLRNNSITVTENLVLLQKTNDFIRSLDTAESLISLQVLLPEVGLKRILQFSEKGHKPPPPGLCLTQGAIDLKKAADTLWAAQSFVTFKALGITGIPRTHAAATTHTSTEAQPFETQIHHTHHVLPMFCTQKYKKGRYILHKKTTVGSPRRDRRVPQDTAGEEDGRKKTRILRTALR